ncbi:MAG TPA: hypothetical protein VMF89_19450, partial [Polyangiales bacterium]|nr:hypothetical protein [Polyangiales bacterium]
MRALLVGAESRAFHALFDPHYARFARPRTLKTKAGNILSPDDYSEALNEAALWCTQCEGIAPSREFPSDVNAKLQRPRESPERWLERIFWLAVRNIERQQTRIVSVDAPSDPNDADSKPLRDALQSADDVAMQAERLWLYPLCATLIIELIPNDQN